MGDRKRVNVEGDRLSSLPDDLIHKILSFISIKHAVETSVLSSRWRYIWTTMPYLSFSSDDFRTLPKFSNFVKHVLLGRNNQIEVSFVELTFRGMVTQTFVKRILDYASSHNVQQLDFTWLFGKEFEREMEVPLSLFSFQSLKHLNLAGHCDCYSIMTPPTWELPNLTTLSLHRVTLHDDNTGKGASLFSCCANLKNVTMKDCELVGLNGFNICHPRLSSLTLEHGFGVVNVGTPQLKNLTIKHWRRIHLISAPNLSSLHYKDRFYSDNFHGLLQLSTELLHLEKVHVCIEYRPPFPNEEGEDKAFAQKIFRLLQQLHNVKFLALNMELVKHLSSSVELISHQPSPFANLKSLNIYPADPYGRKVAMSSEVKSYLLDGSPGATFTMVSHEENVCSLRTTSADICRRRGGPKEVRALMDVALARMLMVGLHVLLDQWKDTDEMKDTGEINKARTKKDKAPMKSRMMTTMHKQGEAENHRPQQDTEMKDHFLESMTRFENYWEDLSKLLEKGCKNTRSVISQLRRIEIVLKRMPGSHQAKLQARYSGLRSKAETVIEYMKDRMKLQCDKKPSFFNERATSSQQCSSS